MTAAYFEDHPTDPEKVILRKPPLDQGADYERGFIDGMQKQMQSSVDKAVNRMAQTQEPVAWMWRCKPYCDWPNWGVSLKRPADSGCYGDKRTEGYEDVPLYTTPPQRTWVGLTDEQRLAEALRQHGLTLIKTANGYDVRKLSPITAHGIKEQP